MSDKIKKELTHEEANNFCVWLQDEVARLEKDNTAYAKTVESLEKAAKKLGDYSGRLESTITAKDKELALLRDALGEVKGFVEWIEILGRTDCEIYKHELKGSADVNLLRINKALAKS